MTTFDEPGERLDRWSDAEYFARTVDEARWLDGQHSPDCGCADCAEGAGVLDLPAGRSPELMLGGEL